MDTTGSPTLDRISAAGVLRVGTTGDYTPFSLLGPDGGWLATTFARGDWQPVLQRAMSVEASP